MTNMTADGSLVTAGADPPDGACAGTGWSAVASAPANSQLAGVLAGFVFAGFVMVLTERHVSPLRVATLRLFIAGFIVLALDSYAFSLLTGDVAERACGRVWTESLIASGMLVVGAVAVISGMAWLLASYAEPRPGGPVAGARSDGMREVERLLRRSVYGISVLTVLLLSTAAHDYVNVAFMGRAKPWWATWVAPLYVLLVGAAMIATVWRRQRREARYGGTASDPSSKELSVAFAGAVSYAVLGTAAIGVITSTPAGSWRPVPEGVALTTVTVVLIMPVPTILALLHAMPKLRPERTPPGSGPGAGDFDGAAV